MRPRPDPREPERHVIIQRKFLFHSAVKKIRSNYLLSWFVMQPCFQLPSATFTTWFLLIQLARSLEQYAIQVFVPTIVKTPVSFPILESKGQILSDIRMVNIIRQWAMRTFKGQRQHNLSKLAPRTSQRKADKEVKSSFGNKKVKATVN